VNMQQPDPVRILKELQALRGGVADTSTLIYLERCSMLRRVCACLEVLVPAGVVGEFGRLPSGCRMDRTGFAGESVDQAVFLLARERSMPVFSEDRRLLMRCHREKIPHYNTLMLLLGLLVQQKIDPARHGHAHGNLLRIARYSPAVRQTGDTVFSLATTVFPHCRRRDPCKKGDRNEKST